MVCGFTVFAFIATSHIRIVAIIEYEGIKNYFKKSVLSTFQLQLISINSMEFHVKRKNIFQLWQNENKWR